MTDLEEKDHILRTRLDFILAYPSVKRMEQVTEQIRADARAAVIAEIRKRADDMYDSGYHQGAETLNSTANWLEGKSDDTP